MAEAFRYKAFISYSHADKQWAAWLHRKLESYRVPRAAKSAAAGTKPLGPVFRDRDELTASTTLGDALTGALLGSEFLILICSPASAKSRWVNEEVRQFRRARGTANVLPLIVGGEPGTGGNDDCLPPALLEPELPGGPAVEPVCADARRHADGKRLAFLKLAAAMLDTGLDDLVRRDQARRQRRLAYATAASMTGTVAMGGLAVYANGQRIEAVHQREVAETNERLATENERRATRTVDFLVDTFEVANPETENAQTITAFSILERGAARIRDELADEPAVQTRLYSAMGSIYQNLGLYQKSDAMLDAGRGVTRPGSPEAMSLALQSARTAYWRGDLEAALGGAERALASINPAWPDAAELTADARYTRGLVRQARLDFPGSLEDLEAAADYYRREGSDGEKVLAAIENLRGSILAAENRFDEAEEVLQSALALNAKKGTDRLDYVRTLNNLAYVSLGAGRAKESVDYSRRAVGIYERVLGKDHPNLATARMMLGQGLDMMGKHGEAAALFIAARDALAAKYPEGNYETGFARVHLARAWSAMGRTDAALRQIDLALADYDASYGGLNPNHGDLEVNRAIVLTEGGRRADAEAACRKGRDILNETMGPDSPVTEGLMKECQKRGLKI